MSPRHRTRPAWRTVDPYAILFGALCGLAISAGIIGLLLMRPILGIG